MKIIVLLYSGGVDSMVCLKRLVKKGIVPFIFHFHCKKLTIRHEKMIRKSAKILSPKSPFYVFETKTIGFDAFWSRNASKTMFGINVGKNGLDKIAFCPFQYADILVVGYHKYRGRFRKNAVRIIPQGQKDFIIWCKKCRLPFMFPLERYRPTQIDREFERLPMKLKKLAISTTRGWFKGIFLPTEKVK
jgi:hypothetical protein